jgi:hypothetical protein
MLVQCARCGKKIVKQQGYGHQGNLFCEDCYMDILSPPKACDPWAVYSAQSFLKGKDKLSTLTPLQLKMVNYIRQRGEATVEEMVENLNLTEEEFPRGIRCVEAYGSIKGDEKGWENSLHTILETSDRMSDGRKEPQRENQSW